MDNGRTWSVASSVNLKPSLTRRLSAKVKKAVDRYSHPEPMKSGHEKHNKKHCPTVMITSATAEPFPWGSRAGA